MKPVRNGLKSIAWEMIDGNKQKLTGIHAERVDDRCLEDPEVLV